MFDRFTECAKTVMRVARREAMKLEHGYVGTEHLLLGVVEAGGVAAFVLRNMTVDVEKIRHEVEKVLVKGPSAVPMGQLPFTPRALKVLELSLEETCRMRHCHIGPEHLLIGLIREHEGIAANVLANLGVSLDEVRDEVLGLLGAGDDPLLDRFTDRAQRVVAFAREDAIRFHHGRIGTGHILLGLVEEGTTVAAKVLKHLKVEQEDVRGEVVKIGEPAGSVVTMERLPFTPGAKKAFELSCEEANRFCHGYIGTEHLFLGLIREEGAAARILVNLGVEVEELCTAVLEFLKR